MVEVLLIPQLIVLFTIHSVVALLAFVRLLLFLSTIDGHLNINTPVLKWIKSRPWLTSGEDGKVHVYLAGDSCGGNIAHHVGVRAAEAQVEVSGNILLHPMFGGEKRTESEKRLDGKFFVTIQDRDWYWRAYLPQGEDRDHPACNIFGPRGTSLEGLKFPKSLIVVAGLNLVQDWQLAYVKGLQESGH